MKSEENQHKDNNDYDKEHQRMNEESDNEEYGYEIYNTTNENNQRLDGSGYIQKASNNLISTESDQVDLLKQKISTQAKRLTELQLYKGLCEKHILQLSPGHHLPITDNVISQYEKDPTYFEQSQAFQNLLMEKEKTLASLRNETLINEEQRNYIEILKQTIESSILKNGFGSVLQKIQSSFPGQSNLDIVIDISRLKSENEKIRKDLIMEQVVLTDMKSELEIYKKQAEDFEAKNKQLKEVLQKEINEKNEAYKGLNQLDKNKGNLLNEIDIAMKDNKALKTNLSEYQCQNKQYEKEILEKQRDINALTVTINELNPLKSKYNDILMQFNELQLKYSEISKYNIDFERSNEKLKIDLDIQLSNAKKLTQLIEENSRNYNEEKQNLIHEHNILVNTIKQSENEQMEISNDLMQKDNEIKRLKEKERDLCQTHLTLIETKNALNEYKQSTENKIKSLSKGLRESQIENDQLKYLNNNLQIELNSKEKEIMIIKNDILKAQSDIKVLKRENTTKVSSIQELSSQLHKKISENEIKEEEANQMKNQYSSLEKELSFWKDKYDQDIYIKTQEVNCLKRDIDDLKYKIEDINKSYSKIVNENTLKNEEIIKADEREKRLLNEFKMLKDNNNDLNHTLENNLLNLKTELKKAFELNNTNSIQTIQIRDLKILSDQLKEDNYKKEDLIKTQSFELTKLKGHNKESEIKYYSLSTSYAAITKMIMSSYNIIQEFDAKFREIIEENKRSSLPNSNSKSHYYSISFQEFINENGSNCSNENDYMRNIERFISLITTEIEILYEHIKSMSNYNDEIEKKMAFTDQSINLNDIGIINTKSKTGRIDGKKSYEGRNMDNMTNNTIQIHDNTITNPTIFNDNMTPLLTKENQNRAKECDTNENQVNELYQEKEQYIDYNKRMQDKGQCKAIDRDKENDSKNNIMISSSFTGMKRQTDFSEAMSHQNTIPMSNYLINSNYNSQYNQNNNNSNSNSNDTIPLNRNIHEKTYELISGYHHDHSFQNNDLISQKYLGPL